MILKKRIFTFIFLVLFKFGYAQKGMVIPIHFNEADKAKDSVPEWSLDFSGFVQADIIVDNKKLKYIDGFLPTYIESNKTDYNTNVTMRQTQLGFGVQNNKTGLRGFVQVDFIGPNNQNNVRLRKLFISYKNWMIGQDWTNLTDLNTWPNLLDFNGPNAGLYARRIQLRYTKRINDKNEFSASIEDPNIPSIRLPENEFDWKMKPLYPNVIGTYKYGAHSYVRGAVILSPISYRHLNDSKDAYETKTTLGYGLYASSVIYVKGKSSFKLVAAAGEGIATNVISYSGEGYDAVPDPSNPTHIKKLPVLSGVAAYENWWNDKWSSVVFYSYSKVGEKKYMTTGMLESVQHAGINTVYQPVSYFKAGFEINYGIVKRYYQDDKDNATRFQISTAFIF